MTEAVVHRVREHFAIPATAEDGEVVAVVECDGKLWGFPEHVLWEMLQIIENKRKVNDLYDQGGNNG